MKISQCFLIWFIETLNVIGAMYRNFYFCMSVCVCMCVDVLFFPVLFPDLFFLLFLVLIVSFAFLCSGLSSFGRFHMTPPTAIWWRKLWQRLRWWRRPWYWLSPFVFHVITILTDRLNIRLTMREWIRPNSPKYTYTDIHIGKNQYVRERNDDERNQTKKRKKIWLVCLVCLVVWLHIIVDDKSDEGVYHSHFHIILGELFK